MFLAIVTIVFLMYLFFRYLRYDSYSSRSSSDLIKRFRKNSTSSLHKNQRLFERYSEYLASNPQQNISLTEWDNDRETLEKANIHKTRLNKFGKSKLNDKTFFLDEEGSVYTISKEGEKIYV